MQLLSDKTIFVFSELSHGLFPSIAHKRSCDILGVYYLFSINKSNERIKDNNKLLIIKSWYCHV